MIDSFKVHMPKSVKKALLETIFSGYIGQGSKVDEFEKKFSKKFGIKNVVSLNSCTSALRLALALIGVGPGDEVISTPYTMVATNTAILEQFAKPVFTDIQYETLNMDPKDIEHRISKKTKAIICVHWGGYPCDLDEIHNIAAKNDLAVIEDAAHALGSKYKGKPIGTISDYTAFSFQAIKHITTGDGGMLTLLKKNKYKEAIRRRWFGIDRKNRGKALSSDPIRDITEVGYKYHMNDVAATIGLEQLKYFNLLFKKRREIAQQYRKGLQNVAGIKLLENKNDRIHANWMFAIHVKRKRGHFLSAMRSKGIGVTIHNWRNDRYSVFGGMRRDLPNLKKANSSVVNLPLHHDISNGEVDNIISKIKNYCKKQYG
jgi:perosamine synthetase